MRSKKKGIIVAVSLLLVGLLAALVFLVILPETQYNDIRQMTIQEVDLSKLEDGAYKGEYTYGHYTYYTEVQVTDHKIEGIKVSHDRDSAYAKAAEGVVASIIAEQKIDVDVVSGATTTSKAILKSVENALSHSK